MPVFFQVTVPPRSIVTGFGKKHELVSSHPDPGIAEPGANCTVTCLLGVGVGAHKF